MENTNKKPKQSNGFAIAGFVLSFFMPILGIVFSAIGLAKAKELEGSGKGLAIAGLTIAIVSLIVIIIVSLTVRK